MSPRENVQAAIGLGCMRLSTAADRDDARSLAVIHTALDAGATLLDTSNAYCRDDTEIGHNERLIARALSSWSGDRSRIEVATKGGLRRPKGAWVADGKAKSLRSACEASLRTLGVAVIDLYQLHAVDPKTPFETSVRALAALKAEGKIKRVGVCNVTVSQIKAARDIVDVDAVQVSLSVLDDENLRNGVAEYCRDHGIRVIAYRPLGGVDKVARLARDPLLVEVATRHSAAPQEIALAWLMDLGAVPLPGATRVSSAASIAAASRVRLTDEDRQRLDAAFSGRLLRVPRAERRPKVVQSGDVVLVTGMPAAGKSSIARQLTAEGYERLNRDERGGTLADLVGALDAGLDAGRRRWVLDNTYATRQSRNAVIECAWKHGLQARCIHLTTSVADAQINAITRLIAIHGRLPMPEELRERGKGDSRYFGPDAQFRYERSLEPPSEDEGFASIETRPFERRDDPNAVARAVFMDFDEVLGGTGGGKVPVLAAADVSIAATAADKLRRLHADGWLLFADAWRPQIARREVTARAVDECFMRARDLLGVDIGLACCPHDAGPPVCWCRKPLPGLLLDFALPRRVTLKRSRYLGNSSAGRTLAQRLGTELSQLSED